MVSVLGAALLALHFQCLEAEVRRLFRANRGDRLREMYTIDPRLYTQHKTSFVGYENIYIYIYRILCIHMYIYTILLLSSLITIVVTIIVNCSYHCSYYYHYYYYYHIYIIVFIDKIL